MRDYSWGLHIFRVQFAFKVQFGRAKNWKNVTYASGAFGMCLEDFYSLFLDNVLERRCEATEKED